MHTEHNPEHDSEQTVTVPEPLYQYPAYYEGFPFADKETRSWTYSLETYQKSACREFNLLVHNYMPGREYRVVGINHWRVLSIPDILDKFRLVKEYLRKQHTIAYTVAEVTKDKFYHPTNKVHHHILIHSQGSENRIRNLFKAACRYAGLEPGIDCQVFVNKPIRTLERFRRATRYILKYGQKYLDKEHIKQHPDDEIILFRPKTGINKIGQVGKWFTYPDGTQARKEDLWKALIDKWYPKVRIRLHLWGTIQIGEMSFPFNIERKIKLTYPKRSS